MPLRPGKSKRSQNIWPIICNESRRRISAPVPPAQVRVEIQLVALLGSRCHLCGRDGSHRPIRYRRNATRHDHSALARVSNPFVVVFTGVFLIALTVSEWPDTRRGDRIKRSVLAKTNAAIEKHFMTLAAKRTQLAREKWSEVDHIQPALSPEELNFLHEEFLPPSSRKGRRECNA